MNPHLSMRSGNPALSSKTFKNAVSISDEKMTIEGTVNKTAMSLLLLMATASYTWSSPSPGLMLFGMFGGFILALVTIFKKNLGTLYRFRVRFIKGFGTWRNFKIF